MFYHCKTCTPVFFFLLLLLFFFFFLLLFFFREEEEIPSISASYPAWKIPQLYKIVKCCWVRKRQYVRATLLIMRSIRNGWWARLIWHKRSPNHHHHPCILTPNTRPTGARLTVPPLVPILAPTYTPTKSSRPQEHGFSWEFYRVSHACAQEKFQETESRFADFPNWVFALATMIVIQLLGAFAHSTVQILLARLTAFSATHTSSIKYWCSCETQGGVFPCMR